MFCLIYHLKSGLVSNCSSGQCIRRTALPPVDSWFDQIHVYSILVFEHKREQAVDQAVREEMRLQTQIAQFCAFGIVIMLLGLNSRVWNRHGLHRTNATQESLRHIE